MNRYDIALGKTPPPKPPPVEYSTVAVPAPVMSTATASLNNEFYVDVPTAYLPSNITTSVERNSPYGWVIRETMGIGIVNPNAIIRVIRE